MSPQPEYLYPRPPAHGEVLEMGGGVFWVRLPLPFALDHVNVCCVNGEGGWWIVDCGVDTEETRAAWDKILREVVGGGKVAGIVVSHFHPDHIGAAGYLADRTGAELFMNRTEWLVTQAWFNDDGARLSRNQAEFFARHGLAAETVDQLLERGNSFRRTVGPPPLAFTHIGDGDPAPWGGDWRCIAGSGHSPQHIAFVSRKHDLFLAGDQVLPRITLNVSLPASEPQSNPLADFLASLDDMKKIPDSVAVLPGHDTPFRNLHARLDALRAHHEERLQVALAGCRQPATAAGLLPQLFNRELDTHQTVFAMGESLSHIAYLHHQGKLQPDTGADGIIRWQSAA